MQIDVVYFWIKKQVEEPGEKPRSTKFSAAIDKHFTKKKESLPNKVLESYPEKDYRNVRF